MSTRLKYDGLPEGAHTFMVEEKPGPDGKPQFSGIKDRIVKGDVIEVEDLDDPNSERARLCRDHIARGLAHVIGAKKAKDEQSKA